MTKNNLLSGVAEGFEPFIIKEWWQNKPQSILFITHTETKAHLAKQQLNFLLPECEILSFPAWDCLPYDRVSPSTEVTTERLLTLLNLSKSPSTPKIIIASIDALMQKLPPKDSILQQSLSLLIGQKLDRNTFISFLTEKGFYRTDTVRDKGEFAIRGDIIDLFPIGSDFPLRIDLFGDEIEQLRYFDPLTQITIGKTESLQLTPASDIILSEATISTFRNNYRHLFGAKITPLYEAISEGRRYAGMEHWLPLFFDHTDTLLDYAKPDVVLVDFHVADAFYRRLELIETYYQARNTKMPGDKTASYNPISPSQFYFTPAQWQAVLEDPKTYPAS